MYFIFDTINRKKCILKPIFIYHICLIMFAHTNSRHIALIISCIRVPFMLCTRLSLDRYIAFRYIFNLLHLKLVNFCVLEIDTCMVPLRILIFRFLYDKDAFYRTRPHTSSHSISIEFLN